MGSKCRSGSMRQKSCQSQLWLQVTRVARKRDREAIPGRAALPAAGKRDTWIISCKDTPSGEALLRCQLALPWRREINDSQLPGGSGYQARQEGSRGLFGQQQPSFQFYVLHLLIYFGFCLLFVCLFWLKGLYSGITPGRPWRTMHDASYGT